MGWVSGCSWGCHSSMKLAPLAARLSALRLSTQGPKDITQSTYCWLCTCTVVGRQGGAGYDPTRPDVAAAINKCPHGVRALQLPPSPSHLAIQRCGDP